MSTRSRLPLALLPAALLAGCAGAANSAAPATTAPAAPAPGAGGKPACVADVGPTAQLVRGAPPQPAPCDARHGAETWRQVTLPAPWSDPGRARPAPGSADEAELGRLAAERCPEDSWRSVANLTGTEATAQGRRSQPTALRTLWYYSPAAEWSAGQRWLRCDLGFAFDQPTRDAVDWKALLAPTLATPEGVRLVGTDCIVSADPAQPEAHTVCDRPHETEVMSSYHPSTGPIAPEAMDQACAEDAALRLGLDELPAGTARYRIAVSARPGTTEAGSATATIYCVLSYQDPTTGAAVRTAGSATGMGTGDPAVG
jgi:hypothetical protein